MWRGFHCEASVSSVTSFPCLSFPVKCPEGSYFREERCVPCPVGFYQERAGSLTCVPCPGGRTTVSAGAFRQTHCESCRARAPPGNTGPAVCGGAPGEASASAPLKSGAGDSSSGGAVPCVAGRVWIRQRHWPLPVRCQRYASAPPSSDDNRTCPQTSPQCLTPCLAVSNSTAHHGNHVPARGWAGCFPGVISLGPPFPSQGNRVS